MGREEPGVELFAALLPGADDLYPLLRGTLLAGIDDLCPDDPGTEEFGPDDCD